MPDVNSNQINNGFQPGTQNRRTLFT
uniref:Uncharacterized protein n=1 Tax=Anguilla anguilla TaxID=7936 RepID=A0A0E9TCD5_ANGAN